LLPHLGYRAMVMKREIAKILLDGPDQTIQDDLSNCA